MGRRVLHRMVEGGTFFTDESWPSADGVGDGKGKGGLSRGLQRASRGFSKAKASSTKRFRPGLNGVAGWGETWSKIREMM